MGRGWRRIAAFGVATLVLLAVSATLWAPAAGEVGPPADPAREAQGEQRIAKIRLAAYAALNVGLAVARAQGDGNSDGPGAAFLASVSSSPLFAPSAGAELSRPPSWAAVAAVAPLLVMALLAANRRPVPSLQLAGPLFSMATTRGPPPPLLSPFLRVVAMALLGLSLVSVHLFEPLLMASTGLLLLSLLIDPSASRRSLRGSVNVL